MSLPSFTGIWRLNLGKSVLKFETPVELLMKIEHEESRVRQQVLTVRKGGEDRGIFEFTIGGETVSAIRCMRAVVRAHWDDRVLIVESRVEAPNGELQLRDHWSLSDNGATLTMAHPDDVLTGQISVLERGSAADTTRFG